jgi:hypothetical protein
VTTQEKADSTENDQGNKDRHEAPTGQADWTWADPRTLKVRPEFQRLIPLQSREEFRALQASIQAEGCRDPLLVWKDKHIVLDGHTRRELCTKHKKQVKVREVELPDEQAAVEYILQIQRQRRNLTREAMSYFRGAEYNSIKQQRGGNRRGRPPKDQSDPMISTAQRLAEKYGVAEMTVKRDGVFAQVIDKIVADHGDPEVRRKLLGADVKLTQGTARVLLKMQAGERKKAVDELIEKGELPRTKKGSTAASPKPKEVAQSFIARLNKKGEGHAHAVFKQMARLLGFDIAEKASDD